jgi:hypothetical protein
MLDTHLEALVTVNEGHHTFLLRYRRDKKIVYGIVEGKDDPMFYRSVIERFLPEEWSVELILAGNKSKVLAVHSAIDWTNFPKNQVAFFVDRDLSAYGVAPVIADDNIYVTDGYSIENAIVNPDVLSRLLTEAYNVVDYTVEESDKIKLLFKEALEEFQKILTPIMAQVLGWRIDKVRADLDDLTLAPLVRLEDGKAFPGVDMHEACSRVNHLVACVGANRYEEPLLTVLEDTFRNGGGTENFVRGKYLIWFLSQYLVHLHANIGKFVSAYAKPPKIKLPVGAANVMVIAAPRARIPQSLKKFIEETFLSYVEPQTT